MIKEITKYIASGLTLTVGTNIFAGAFPVNCTDNAVAIFETPAGEVNFYIPDYAGKIVQVIVRDSVYIDGHDRAVAIFSYLHGKAGITLPIVDGGTEYLANVIEALNLPGFIGQDERGLFEFVTNVIFRIQNK